MEDNRLKLLTDLFNKLCSILGYDYSDKAMEENAKKTSHKISLFTHDFEKDLLKVKNYIATEELDYAIIQFNSIIEGFFHIYNPFTYNGIKTQKAELYELIELISDSIDLYDVWLKTDYVKALEFYHNNELFKPDEINSDKIHPELFLRLKDVLNGDTCKFIKTFSYKKGSAPITDDINLFKLNKEIVLSDNLNEWINIKARKEISDVTEVTMFMKIEEIVDYSYFLFVINYKDHVFLITDQNSFSNPLVKCSSRNPYRRREQLYDTVDFPYGLIDKLPEIRKSNVLPKSPDLNLELYFYPLSDLDLYCRAYITAFVSQFISKIKTEHESLNRILTFDGYLNQKMIGEHIPLTDVDNNSMSYYDGRVKEEIEELLETIEEVKPTTAIATLSKDIILKSDLYDKDWLTTPEHFDNLVKWYHFNEKRDDYKNKIKEIFTDTQRIEDTELLGELIKKNSERFLEIAFVADTVYNINENVSSFTSDKTPITSVIVRAYEPDHMYSFNASAHLGMYIENPGTRNEKYMCDCKRFKAHHIKRFTVFNYKELMALLQLTDRKQLPKYYRQYRSHINSAYRGNSITSNVNPLTLLEDPCSRRYSNGFIIDVIMCKHCANKYSKKYKKFDIAQIIFDGNSNYSIKQYDKDQANIYSSRI